MKKTVAFRKIVSILTLSLLLVLSTTACGEKPASGNGSSQDNPTDSSNTAEDSSQSTADGSDPAGEPSQNISDGSDPGVSIAPGAPNVPGVGDNSSLYTQNIPGAGQSGTGIYGTDNNFSSSYTWEDVFNGSLDGLEFGPLSSVTEFYNSDARIMLEDYVNQFLHELNDMLGAEIFRSASISVLEPDRIIYTYQYGALLDNATIMASLETDMETLIPTMQSSISHYQSYGIPVEVIQLNYLNADGDLIYTIDITEDLDPSGLPGSGLPEGTGGSLQEWLDSDEAAETLETINNLIAPTGITLSFAMEGNAMEGNAMEGNTLIYQYYLPAGLSFDDFTEEEKEATFDAMVDANADSIQTLFTMFEAERGLTLDAVRIIVCSADGTELYRRDVTP